MKKSKSLKLNYINYGKLQSDSEAREDNNWAYSDRESVSDTIANLGNIDTNELKSIQSQLLTLAIEANKRPKLNIWQELNEHLNEISSLSAFVLLDTKLESELDAVYRYLLDNSEYSYLLPEMETRLREFLKIPKKTLTKPVDRKRDEEEDEHYYPLPIRKYNKKPSSKIMPENVIEWFVDPTKGDLFNPATIDKNISVKPKKIKIKDFLAAISGVAKEIIFSQYAFDKPLENLIKAFDVDLSEFKSTSMGNIEEDFSEIEEYSEQIPKREDLTVDRKNINLAKGFTKPKSGRDTVMYMIKCFHLREMRVAYLNYTKQRIRDLYSLTVVSKTQVEPEHYIFSSFGIIHRYPDGGGIAMSLTDWYRESILYCALKCLPFVKQFLVRKYFQGWRALTISNRHLSAGKYLCRNLLPVNLTYGKSLLQILKLLDEISQITFVPTELLEIQTETSFTRSVSQISSTANEYLIKFYRYVQIMVNETAAELYKALQFSQAQLHSNNLYSNDSIYMKKLKQKNRQQALNECLHQVYKLGDFVKLVNFMLNNKIVEISLNNITILGELLCAMEMNSSESDKLKKVAIFSTKVDIISTDNQSVLKAFPEVEDIESMFTEIINSIPKLILKHCYPLDGLIRSDYLNRFNDIIIGNLQENQIGYSTILRSKSETKTEIMAESEKMLDKITKPDLHHIRLPVKSEDNLRVATPPAVNPNIFNRPSLKLIGRSIPAKFTPINTEDVFEILKMNPLYCSLINGFTDLFRECQKEMNSLFQEVKWLIDVRNEYNEWSKINMIIEWVNQSPYLYEQKLVKVKRYIHNLENTEKQVILTNRIFKVSFEGIIEELLSEMEFELEAISDYILNSVRKLGLEFIGKITDVLQFLRERKLEVELFTKVLHYIGYSRDNHAEFQKSVDYIKSLFDMLRISAKHINEKDKVIEDEVTTLWESFMFQLQEANDFVNSEKENVLFTIKTRIKELEDSARNIEDAICGSRYSTLSDDNKQVLMEISKILEDCDQIHTELSSLFKCYQSIAIEECPKTVDLDQIRSVVNLVNSNWALMFTTLDQIESWKAALFSRFQVSSAAEIILEWKREIAAFKVNYNSRIVIVEQTEDCVNEFASFMQFFRQLSSQVFTLQHWQQFFLQIGHEFIDPYDKLTVQDLIDLDVREHSRILDALYNDATMKSKSNKEFDHHLRYWMTKEFEFEAHRSDLCCQRSFNERFETIAISKTPVESRTRSELEKYHDNKNLEYKLEKLSRLPIVNNENREIFLIGELNKLNEDITDSIISIQMRKPQTTCDDRYKLLVRALEDLRITNTVLEECQEKWLFLERIFEEAHFVRAHLESAAEFVTVNKALLSLLDQIKQSPLALQYVPLGKVLLSELESKDFNLKSRLLELIETMNEIICNVEEILKNVRHHFPRLFFLPDFHLIELLNCKFSQNIQNINRFIPAIFPAVKCLTFDIANNALSVTSGTQERIDLYKPVSARNSVSQWLKEFELILKSTLRFYIESCIVQQTEQSIVPSAEGKGTIFVTEGERTRSTMFQEIDTIDRITQRMSEGNREKVDELVNSILLTYESWLMKYPLQVLLLADKLAFSKTLKHAVNVSRHEIESLMSNLVLRKHNYIRLVNEISQNAHRNQRRILYAVQSLIVLNDRHIDILDKLAKDCECSPQSFLYQTIVKYDVAEEDSHPLVPSNGHRFGNVTIKCFDRRLVYDYEYIALTRCGDLFLTSVSEQVTVNMLLALHSYEIPSVVGSTNHNKLEIANSFSEVLGRNLFPISLGKPVSSESFRKYFLGALMSGSLLFVNNINEISAGDMSDISKYLWQLRLLLREQSRLPSNKGTARRLSLPSRVAEETSDELHCLSERIVASSSEFGRCRSSYYEMQTNKLNKGNNWPFFTPEYERSAGDNNGIYTANYITDNMEAYGDTVQVRYGFGILCGITNGSFDLGPVPMSLRGQMRIHCLIESDQMFNIKSHLIMASQENNSDKLVACISSLFEQVNRFQRHLSGVVSKLTPLVISKCDWSIESPIKALKRSFITEIGERLSNELKDRDIFLDCLDKCFQWTAQEKEETPIESVEEDSGFLHQIKCQLRLKNREILSSDIDKIIELKSCTDFHQTVIVTGPSCSGKSSAIDILVQALNAVIVPGSTPRFDMKSRGNIDVLKSISIERKVLSQSDYLDGREANKRIILRRVTLANFTGEELKSQRWVTGTEQPSVLMSIFHPILKLQKLEKFRLWLCVETDWLRIHEDIAIIKSCLGTNVKLIMEVTGVMPRVPEISLLHGIVQFPRIQNITELIIEQHMNSLLSQQMISYYGCKYLKEITGSMFSKLFDALSFQIDINHESELEINWILQTLGIFGILLLENKDSSQELESIYFLEKRLNTFLCFSIIQAARGVAYLLLVDNRLVGHEDFERILRETMALICPEVEAKTNGLVFSIFGLMIDLHEMSLKRFDLVKGSQVPPFGTCTDGVARFLIQLLVKHNRSLYLTGARSRIDAFTGSIRFNKRIKLDSCNEFPMLRKALHDKRDKYWQVLSNKDILFGASDNRDILLLDDFSAGSHASGQCNSLLQFSMEHKFLYNAAAEGDSGYEEHLAGDSVVILTRSHESSNELFNHASGKWTRWFAWITVIEPHVKEVPTILYKPLYCWFRQVPRIDKELANILTKKFAAFIADVCLSIENENRTHLISEICDSNVPMRVPHQQTWSRIIQIAKSLISLPLDMFVGIFRKFEKLFPLERESHLANPNIDETLKAYRVGAIKVRILRYLIFTVSRFILDPLEWESERDRVISTINLCLERHFFSDLSFQVDEILLRNFPLSIGNIDEILMLPSRICRGESPEEEQQEEKEEDINAYYQPILEPHSWRILDLVKDNISRIETVKAHLASSFHLKAFVQTETFLHNLMGIYKHFSQYSLCDSALLVRSRSSLVSGGDWGVFISGVIRAAHMPLRASSRDSPSEFRHLLQSAMRKAGCDRQKVVFHIDSSLTNVTREICSVLMSLTQQDSSVSILQFLCAGKSSLVKLGSEKEIRLTRVLLENIRRNLKILITVDSKDLRFSQDLETLSDWFLSSSHNYLVLDDQHIEIYRRSLDSMMPVVSRPHSSQLQLLAEAHIYFNKFLYEFLQALGIRLHCTGKYLAVSMAIYSHLIGVFRSKFQREIQRVELAIRSLRNAEMKIENLSVKLESLEKQLGSLNGDIGISANQLKSMRESYGSALNQCQSQERLIRELTGPLNELKEKSKSDLNDVSPTYLAALETIRNLDPGAVEEVRTYVKPPQPVRDLVEIIFLLLGYDSSWEEIKEIMVKVNLYEELLYFDKDHIGEEKYRTLSRFLATDSLRPESLVNISRAAASLSGWLGAICNYTNLSREINPQLGKLLAVQDQVSVAQRELGKMKVRADLIRQDLEAKLDEHKELKAKKKSLTDRIRDSKYRIDSGRNLLSDVESHGRDWSEQRSQLLQSMQDLPHAILSFIIHSVYLSQFPLSRRNEIFDGFLQGFVPAAKQYNRLTIFEEGDLYRLIDWHQWNSSMKLHLDNSSDLALILACPSISFPELGSLFMIHYHSDDGAVDLVGILKGVLESEQVLGIRRDVQEGSCEQSMEFVHYLDCARMDERDLEDPLVDLMSKRVVLLIDNIELLRELGPTLRLLLYGSSSSCFEAAHPLFRLVLLTRLMGGPCDLQQGLFTSDKLLHYQFAFTRQDLHQLMSDLAVSICQPVLFAHLLQLDKQLLEVHQLCQFEKKSVLETAAKSVSEGDCDPSSVNSDPTLIPSILDVPDFHSRILATDSKLLELDSTNNTLIRKSLDLRKSYGKVAAFSQSICLLLSDLGMFPFESVAVNPRSGYRLVDWNELIREIKRQISIEVDSVTILQNVDPEISDEFLQKLIISTLTAIIKVFDSKLSAIQLVEGVVEFCIDSIAGDMVTEELILTNEADFLKQAILCKTPDQLVGDVSQNSVDFIHQQTNDKISKTNLLLSLIIETNLSSLTGLSKTFVDNADLWKEYLKLPFIDSSRMPGFSVANQPDLLHKAVIWRILNPSSIYEIYSSLIAHVFGENILAFAISRPERLKLSMENSSCLRPLVLLTVLASHDCLFSPLELIEKHYKQTGSNPNKLLIDCTSRRDLAMLNIANKSEGIPSIYDHIMKPCWIILLNAHLYTDERFPNENGLLTFCNQILKGLLKAFNGLSCRDLHPECKLFIICENPEYGLIPEILLDRTNVFFCRAATDFDWKANAICHTKLPKHNRLTKAIFNVYSGLFGIDSFRNVTVRNRHDLEIVLKLSSCISSNHIHAIAVFNTIFYNKILQNGTRNIVNQVCEDVSMSIQEYLDDKVSDVGLVRAVNDSFNKHMSLRRKPNEDKLSIQPINNNVMIDQQLIDECKFRLKSICQQLKQLINAKRPISCTTNQIYIKKLAASLYHNLLSLPIWSMRILSNFRFDSKISTSDIDTIVDQYFISNNKLPNRWAVTDKLISISDWLNCIDNLTNEMSRLVVETDEQLIEIWLNNPRLLDTFSFDWR